MLPRRDHIAATAGLPPIRDQLVAAARTSASCHHLPSPGRKIDQELAVEFIPRLEQLGSRLECRCELCSAIKSPPEDVVADGASGVVQLRPIGIDDSGVGQRSLRAGAYRPRDPSILNNVLNQHGRRVR